MPPSCTHALISDDATPSPLLSCSSLEYPSSAAVYDLAERVFNRAGVYNSVVERIVGYFLTDVSVEADSEQAPIDQNDTQTYRDILLDDMSVRQCLLNAGLDYWYYGSHAASVLPYTYRTAECAGCKMSIPLKSIMLDSDQPPKIDVASVSLRMYCRKCGTDSTWKLLSRMSKSETPIIKRWSPRELLVKSERHTRREEFVWSLQPDYVADIRRGDWLSIDAAPDEVLRAVSSSYKYILLNKSLVKVLSEKRLAGQAGDAPRPRFMSQLGSVYTMLLLQWANESLAAECVSPFRSVSPATSQASDRSFGGNYNDFRNAIRRALDARNKKPGHIHVFPGPVTYDSFSGDANRFIQPELLEHCMDQLAAAIGAPVEFVRGQIGANHNPVMLRIFEAQHADFVEQLQQLLQFIADAVGRLKGWRDVKVRLEMPSFADQLERQQLLLQLAIDGKVPWGNVLPRVTGQDYLSAVSQRAREDAASQAIIAKQQATLEEGAASAQLFPPAGAASLLSQQQQAQQQAMQGGAGGPPATGMATSGATDLQTAAAEAEAIVNEILPMDETSRRRRLKQVREQNPQLADLVVRMHERRRATERQQRGDASLAAEAQP